MDTVVNIVNQIASIGGTVLPLLPYIFIMIMVYQIMGRFIKPWIRSHKIQGTNKFTDIKWLLADRWAVVFCPVIFGAVLGLGLSLCHVVVNVFYSMFAGVSAQTFFVSLEHILKERGVAIPSDFESMNDTIPPGR
jgi:hypothetical protein